VDVTNGCLHCVAVGADNVVTEPATSIKFSSSLTVPDSSTTLSLLGVGNPTLYYKPRNFASLWLDF
jgi:hypothetical protein